MVGNASQVKDTETERRNKGRSYTVLVLLIFIASYLHMFIETVLALHSSHMQVSRHHIVQSQESLPLYMYV